MPSKTKVEIAELSEAEIKVLRGIGESLSPIPKLKIRYLIFAVIICAQGLLIGSIGLISPEWFLENLISPSINETQLVLVNTQIRGAAAIFFVLIWIFNIFNEKWSIRITNCAMAWVILMTIYDFTKILVIDFFQASPMAALFTFWRPVLIFLIYITRSRMNEYFQAKKIYQANKFN